MKNLNDDGSTTSGEKGMYKPINLEKEIDKDLEQEIYNLLYKPSVLSDGNIGVRVIHEDEWPIDELLSLFSKTNDYVIGEDEETVDPFTPIRFSNNQLRKQQRARKKEVFK